MNSLNSLLNTLKEKNIQIGTKNGSDLILNTPDNKISADLIGQIKSFKFELLSFLNKNDSSIIKKANLKSEYNLSLAQLDFFLIHAMHPRTIAYNMPQLLEFNFEPELEMLKQSFNTLIKRHFTLRTTFGIKENQIYQKINDNVNFILEHKKFSQEIELKDFIHSFVSPFELDKYPLFKACFIKLNEKNYLLLDFHHIISDGISNGIFLRELSTIYNKRDIPELKLQYVDFAEWHIKQLESNENNIRNDFWKSFFKEKIASLDLFTDFNRNEIGEFKGKSYRFEIDALLSSKLKSFAIKENTTLNYVFLSLYGLLLHKYTQQSDFCIGTIINGRNYSDLHNVLGVFVRQLPIRIQIEKLDIFNIFLKKNLKLFSQIYENQECHFEKIAEFLELKSESKGNSLFNTALIFHNNESIVNEEIQDFIFKKESIGWSNLKPLITDYFENKTSKLDISLDISNNYNGGFVCNIEYSTSLFKDESVHKFAKHFTNLIRIILVNPEIRISEITLIEDLEKEKILSNFNNTINVSNAKFKTESLKSLINNNSWFFQDSVNKFGENESKIIEKVASVLSNNGITSSDLVGISTSRSLNMLCSIFGILKAGAAYLPLDPSLPIEKLKFIIEDASPKYIIVEKRESHYSNIGYNNLIVLNELTDTVQLKVNKSNTSDFAYVMYTSGSTGKPKGVVVRHNGVINRIEWGQNKYKLYHTDVILFKTPYHFDVSVPEIFWGLLSGSKTVLLPSNEEGNPKIIVEYIEKFQVTQLHFVPSMLNTFLDYLETIDVSILKTVKRIFATGEALTVSQVNRFNKILFETNQTKLINLYGPTEASIEVTFFECSPFDDKKYQTVPIGKPIDNVQIHILDPNFNIQPIGIPGELYISGIAVAEGYLNRPELNEKAFLEDPYFKGQKMYKTGDWARWLEDGNIEFLGRKDGQVKIRGMRIELGEIEETMKKHEEIHDAIVVVKGKTELDKKLVAYYTSNDTISTLKLRSFLKQFLQYYYIPSNFIKIENIPLTPSGKTDRKKLELLTDISNEEKVFLKPSTLTEIKMASIWESVLNIKNVSKSDDFFMLGGNSLSAVKAMSLAKEKYNIDLGLRDFINQSLADICSTYDNKK